MLLKIEMQDLTLPEALEKIKTYEAQFSSMNKDLTDMKTFVAEAKKAAEDEKKKKEEDEKEGKTHMAKAKEALKAVEEETDPDKIRKAIKEAAKYMKADTNDEHQEDEKKDDDEKDANAKTAKTLKKFIAEKIQKPLITQLNAAYKGMVSDEKLKQYNANWINMDAEDLNEEVEKVKLFVGNTINNTVHPMGFSTEGVPETFSASTNIVDTYSAKVDKMELGDLFNGGRN